MFQHMLIPTDGSALSRKAVEAGIALAKRLDVPVTGYFALPVRFAQPDAIAAAADVEYAARMRHEADLALEVISREAELQRVRCDTFTTEETTAYGGIVAAAKRCGCDFIFMASHGRTGEPAAILGSVAQKVVQLAHVPVVVFRTA